MTESTTITNEIVRLRECEEPPFEFWQIAAILKARYPGLELSALQVRDLYCVKRVEGGIVAHPDQR